MPAFKYINRELSSIEFNARVLHETSRKELPLMERLKFLTITASNFDEFFQVRVAAIKRAHQTSPHKADSSGLTPSALLKKISARCHQLTNQEYEILTNQILPLLAKEGIAYVSPEHYTVSQRAFAEKFFTNDVFPLLTPLRTDSNEFPHIGNLKLHGAYLLDKIPGIDEKQTPLSVKAKNNILALVQIPSSIPRVVWLPSEDGVKHFTVLDDIITLFANNLFPGFKIKESMLFKVTRDADFSVDESETANYIQAMADVLDKRQSSFAVRMVCNNSSQKILSILKEKLKLEKDDIYEVNGLLDPTTLVSLTQIEEAQKLLYPDWQHFYPAGLPEEGTYWDTFRQRDVLLNVPYESYEPVIKFIKDAAEDPRVLAIKMTLYRTGSDSPIIEALETAARNGKQVTVFVELKARFDEERNISWANRLEKAGAIVVYGIVNLKVHAKICLVVRKESDGLRRYVHLSTGNYNPKTAKLYQDLSLFTSNYEIATDATLFFNTISGYSTLQNMQHIYMAPVTLKSRLLEMIEREIKLSTKANPGLIVAKMNSLAHPEIINALYRASNAGVKIVLNVRGICMLIPGVKGMSENIKVVSIIDRYLEHSRIFYFQNGGAEELYLSSADWMDRNLDKRIELMFPVTDKNIFKAVKETLMLYFQDNTHSYTLLKDSTWKPNIPEKKELPVSVQDVLYRKYKKKNDTSKSSSKKQFEVRRKN